LKNTARCEAETELVHREDVIGIARRVGVVFLDPQVGLVVQQAIEHVGRVAHTDVHDLGVERRVLVGDMGVERPPWAAPVAPLRLELGQVGGRHLAALAGDLEQPVLVNQAFDAGRQVERLPRLEAFDVFQHVPRIRLGR
jgi:hypothetical protein